MVRIRYSIGGAAVKLGGYQGEIEIDDAELPDDADERAAAIAAAVESEVENAVQWGWEEIPS
jgi:hypothetical protein